MKDIWKKLVSSSHTAKVVVVVFVTCDENSDNTFIFERGPNVNLWKNTKSSWKHLVINAYI